MIITIKCEKCGNEVVLRPEENSSVVWASNILSENDFFDSADVSVDLLEDVVEDECDVDANLEELFIKCRKCGEDITLYF